MSQSLSVILPVHNVEKQLADRVVELLEVFAELTSQLELLIVDDGSTDATEEVAMELCRKYPQVNILRHTSDSRDMAAARAGIKKTTGDMVLIHDINSPLGGDAIRQFWAMRDDQELVFARSEPAHGPRSPRFARQQTSAWTGTQMLRREAVDELQDANPNNGRISRVTRTDVGDVVSNPNSMLSRLTELPAKP